MTVTGLVGNFQALKALNQSSTFLNSRIAFSSVRNGIANIFVMDADGSNVTQVTSEAGVANQPCFSPDGSKIAYTLHGASQSDIFVINVDGTGRTSLTNTSGFSESSPTFSPDGLSVAFQKQTVGSSTTDVCIVNVASKVVTQITNTGTGASPSWNTKDGDLVVHMIGAGWESITPAGVVDASGVSFVDDVTAARAGRAHASAIELFAGDLYLRSPSTGSRKLVTGPVNELGDFSPDSKMVLYQNTATDTLTTQLFRADAVSGNLTRITNDIFDYNTPTWGFLPASTVLIGSSNALALNASGIIYGQAGNQLTAALAFKATTQSTVVVAAPGQQIPGSNITYTIDADDLTNVSYENGTMLRPIRVVGPGSSVGDANGAIVSINALTGNVVNVLAFAGSRGPRPKISHIGTDTVIEGTFSVVTDEKGKDLAHGSYVGRVRVSANGKVSLN
jgi:TolB protein